MILAERRRLRQAPKPKRRASGPRSPTAQADLSSTEALIGHLKVEIEKLRRQLYGCRRKRPSRKPFPDHLSRERVVIPAPESCPCCGSRKLSKRGDDITETLGCNSSAMESDPDARLCGAPSVPQAPGSSSCHTTDLNPIERVFAKLKTLLRKAAERTVEARRRLRLPEAVAPASASRW